jgi:hypothetical protein
VVDQSGNVKERREPDVMGKPPPEGANFRTLPRLLCRSCGQPVGWVHNGIDGAGMVVLKCIRPSCRILNWYYAADRK